MSIKRYLAVKDSVITNAFGRSLNIRSTLSNMGESDVLEIFSIYNQDGKESKELSRILIQFPVENIVSDRQEERTPPSGNVQFIMKMSNAKHRQTLPTKFTLIANPVTKEWIEGAGLDIDSYKDQGPVNWLSASFNEAWALEGGDVNQSISASQFFKEGTEDLEMDITNIVESWIDGTLPNYGLMISLSSSHEQENTSYYTKKFFARGSEYFFKRPWVEARWDSTIKDDRGKFYLYNPFVPEEENKNILYFNNTFKGKHYDIPSVGTGEIYVGLYAQASLPLGTPLPLLGGVNFATGSWVKTGVYKVEIGINTTYDTVYDIWFDSSNTPIATGGPIEIINPDKEQDFSRNNYNIAIKKMKPVYSRSEVVRLQTLITPFEWEPNSYTSYTTNKKNIILSNVYYKITRVVDGIDVIPYGTGSLNHTRMSHDKNGNYMDLEIGLLEAGYSYSIKFAIKDNGDYSESKETFKFRVEE